MIILCALIIVLYESMCELQPHSLTSGLLSLVPSHLSQESNLSWSRSEKGGSEHELGS